MGRGSFGALTSHARIGLVFCLLAVLVPLLPAEAADKVMFYAVVDVRMTLNKDTSIDVVETREVMWSGAWNGLERDYSLYGCDDIRITGVWENGKKYTRGSTASKGGYAVERKRGSVNVKLRSRNVSDPVYNNDVAKFQIRYRLTGAVGHYPKRDVLHWKPVAEKRASDIGWAYVTLELPEAPEAMDVVFYTKAMNPKWEIDRGTRRTVRFAAANVSKKDVFEIKVSLPKGLLERGASFRNAYFYNIKPFVLPVAIIGGIVLWVVLWFAIGRDPEPDVISSQVPSDIMIIPPGISGLVIDESFDERDLTATILDLARRGYISVKETTEPKRFEPGYYRFKLIKVPEKGELAEFEDKLLEGLFGSDLAEGEKAYTSKLKNKFYKNIPEIKKAAWNAVNQLGWFDITPHRARKIFVTLGLLMLIPSLLLTVAEKPEFLFFAIWGSGFGGIPGFILVSTIKRKGLKGCLPMIMLVPFVVIGMGVLIGASYHFYRSGGWAFDFGAAGMVLGILMCMAAPSMARKSRVGAGVNHRVRELRNRLTGSYPFDRSLGLQHLLPWAVAFGVTEHALQKVTDPELAEVPYYEPHRRYDIYRSSGSGGVPSSVSFSSMASGLNAMASAIGSTLSSAPSSSGSGGGGGGFSGGGSSGGGGGGGGGSSGGW
jgi:uncharacterized membrane protein YgcG